MFKYKKVFDDILILKWKIWISEKKRRIDRLYEDIIKKDDVEVDVL